MRVLLVVVLLVISSCGQIMDRYNDGDFYTATKKGDLFRFPVLEPIEVFSSTNFKGTDWFLSLPYESEYSNDHIDIDSIGVKDSFIVAYNNLVYLPYEMTSAWIIIKGDKVTMLRNKESYENYLSEHKLDNIKLYHPHNVYDTFVKTEKVPWIH